MTSATSFFNFRVLRKDITRFAPVWSLYTIFVAIMVLGNLHGSREPDDAAATLGYFLNGMPWVNLFYALLCATLLFGDLFVPRLCYALHAMPLRREGWFLTHITAGFLFSLVPDLLVALLSISELGDYWYAAFSWLLGAQLQYLFFFGAAVFCALCAGNRLATSLMYGIVNFTSLLVYWMAVLFYEPTLYGFTFRKEAFFCFSPAVYFSSASQQPFWFLEDSLRPVGDFWGYSAAIGGIGLVLLILALVLYRRRHLESAGDFIAFKPVAIGFRVVYTLAVGLLFYFFGELFLYDATEIVYYGLMVMGMVVGYFTAQMMLRRTVKVFRLRNVFGCGILIGLVALSVFITALDPFGVTRRVPDPEDVVSISYSGYYNGSGEVTVTDPDDIADLVSIHQNIVDQDVFWSGKSVSFSIYYELSSGLDLERHYCIAQDSEAARAIEKYLSRPEYVLGYSNWDGFVRSVFSLDISMSTTGDTVNLEDPEQIRALLEAVRADCEAGRITAPERYLGGEDTYVAWLGICYNGAYSGWTYGLSIYSNYTETWNWLQENVE